MVFTDATLVCSLLVKEEVAKNDGCCEAIAERNGGECAGSFADGLVYFDAPLSVIMTCFLLTGAPKDQ